MRPPYQVLCYQTGAWYKIEFTSRNFEGKACYPISMLYNVDLCILIDDKERRILKNSTGREIKIEQWMIDMSNLKDDGESQDRLFALMKVAPHYVAVNRRVKEVFDKSRKNP